MDSDISGGLYRDLTDYARSTPHWVHDAAELWTEAGLLLFGALFALAWWRARGLDAGRMALALLAPLATATGYVGSESLKSLVDEERPCRAVAGAAASLVPCPPTGDWSFPSNHSAIAGAAAAALVVVRPRIAWLTVPMALLMAFSRVFVGVHYPHDVAAGLLLGAAVAVVSMRLPTRPAASLVATVRTSRSPLAQWFAGRGPAVETGPGAFAGRGPAVETGPGAGFPATGAGVKYTDPDAGVYSDPDPVTGRPERIPRVRR
ncbi:phosphatase PAP2 family protein [Streptomyces wuyuanensis]|uniref:phosphatase PAP2 family protein n=1 Tax=Streptomyces wuyuanensis TaxID=1196353 RepID=UPI003717DC62